MRKSRLAAAALLVVLLLVGCRGTASSRRVAKAEPALIDESAPAIVEEPSKPVTLADRHPLLAKPKQYYDSSGNNKVVKVAAGTLIGVPAGIVGEIRQMVKGKPKAPAASY